MLFIKPAVVKCQDPTSAFSLYSVSLHLHNWFMRAEEATLNRTMKNLHKSEHWN